MTLLAMPDAARSLEQQAAAIAADATTRLLASQPESAERIGADAAAVWTDHLQQRVIELCAALAAGQVDLFVSRVAWSRDAMTARKIGAEDLQNSLACLREALDPYIKGEALQAAHDCLDHAITEISNEKVTTNMLRLDAGLESERIALRYIQAVINGNVIPGMAICWMRWMMG